MKNKLPKSRIFQRSLLQSFVLVAFLFGSILLVHSAPSQRSFMISPGRDRSFQENIQRELMSTDGPAQSWPPAPRAITEISSVRYQTFIFQHGITALKP